MKKTRSHDSRGNLEHDWISSMPDELLTHILSFLTTKEAVQTCVLSKRWKNTWVAVPSLHMNDNDFLIDDWSSKDDCSGDSDEERRIAVARSEQLRMSAGRFERFMTGFLDNRAPTNLDRVCCMRQFYDFEPDASFGWLDRVLLLMPLHIQIFIASWAGNLLDVPDLVFSCASLQHLSMSFYAKVKTIIRPVSINLPSLKFLELTKVELQHDFTQKLFMGCPSLERLILCCCELNFSSISSEVLKELTLNDCLLYEQMQISCPNLVSLFMRIDLVRGGISLKNMSSLVNAYIRLYQFPVDYVPVLSLFCGLSNVTNLKLHLHLLPNLKEQLEKEIPNCRNFNNLKKLVVSGKWDMSYDFYLIACLLKRSPNLKKLGLLLLDESQGQIQEPRQEVSGEVLFQHEYLEKVKISTMYGRKLSSELSNAMIKTLGLYVKKIGNLIMT